MCRRCVSKATTRRHVSADHHTITFRFDNHGAIDGLNFRTRCAPSITFSFVSDGRLDAGGEVTIGHGGTNPGDRPVHDLPHVAATGEVHRRRNPDPRR